MTILLTVQIETILLRVEGMQAWIIMLRLQEYSGLSWEHGDVWSPQLQGGVPSQRMEIIKPLCLYILGMRIENIFHYFIHIL